MWTLLENNGTLYYWDLNLKKESFNFDEKMKKCFKNGRPKIQSEYCCIAKIKYETNTGLAIAVWLLRNLFFLRNCVTDLWQMKNKSKLNYTFLL